MGSILEVILAVKIAQKMVNLCPILDHFFWLFWSSLGCLLGAFLGFQMLALLRGLWTQKLEKTNGFLRFLKMKLVGSLTLPMALFG